MAKYIGLSYFAVPEVYCNGGNVTVLPLSGKYP